MAELLRLTEFKGMNTNSPAGTVPQPNLLENVNLDRTGGYSPMWARTQRLVNVTRVLSAGVGEAQFIETGAGISYWPGGGSGTSVVAPGVALTNAVLLMPGLLLTPSGYVTKTGTTGTPTTITSGNLTTNAQATSSGKFDPATTYEFLVEAVPVAGAAYSGTVVLADPGAALSSPYYVSFVWNAGPPPLLRFYYRVPADPTRSTFTLIGTNQMADGRLARTNFIDDPTAGMGTQGWTDGTVGVGQDNVSFTTTSSSVATYHQGRIFLAGATSSYQTIEGKTAPVPSTDSTPTRLYFSEVIATASTTSLPVWSLVNYVDVPLRVSSRIVALASVGNYLYIFGDRELLLLTGDPSSDARIESIGDSIGAVSAGTVQQLSGTVYWLSDSGLMAVQGGQVREVGADVRDLLLNLNGLVLTSTVDFRREQYLISDGTIILVYHAREGGWTTRSLEGPGGLFLLYAGGTPLVQDVGTLYAIGGETPTDGSTRSRLTMRLRWPPYELGSWTLRKAFTALLFGIDLSSSTAYITNVSKVDGLAGQTASSVQTVAPGSAGAVRLHLTNNGLEFSGLALGLELTVTTQDARGVVRPPLVVLGNQNGDELWGDDGF